MYRPMQPKPSSAVILVDPYPDGGLKVFLVRRSSANRFMPGRHVFPGGGVEPWDGNDPDSSATRLTCALRELWEETGVILADDGRRASCQPPDALAHARAALQRGEWDLAEATAFLGLEPAPEALFPYARWITPEASPQRYDTIFYAALMPRGQSAFCDGIEASQGLWVTPREALEGRVPVSLAPPQVRILGELAAFGSLARLMEHCRNAALEPILPYLWTGGAHKVVIFPWDRDYTRGHPGEPRDLGDPCPAWQATRMLLEGSSWRPLCKA